MQQLTLSDLITLIPYVLNILTYLAKKWLQLYRQLSQLYARIGLMKSFIVSSVLFGICAFVEIRGINPSYPLQSLQPLFQWSAVVLYKAALLCCIPPVLMALFEGVKVYRNRTKYVFIRDFDPNDPRFFD